MKKILFNRTTFFVLFALAAVVLMGSTITRPVSSDLHRTAGTLAGESAGDIRNSASNLVLKNPGAILRANVIK